MCSTFPSGSDMQRSGRQSGWVPRKGWDHVFFIPGRGSEKKKATKVKSRKRRLPSKPNT